MAAAQTPAPEQRLGTETVGGAMQSKLGGHFDVSLVIADYSMPVLCGRSFFVPVGIYPADTSC